MMAMYGCQEWVYRVVASRNGEALVTVGLDTGILKFHDEHYFLGFLEFLETRYAGLASLALMLHKDLGFLRGYAHVTEDRVIARLKKFLRLLRSIYVIPGEEWYWPYMSLYDIFQPQAYEIERAIKALEFFRGEVHRVRDRGHELVYPHLSRALSGLLEKRMMFELADDTTIECTAIFRKYELKTDIYCSIEKRKNCLLERTWSIPVDGVKEILNKRIERRSRRGRRSRLDGDYYLPTRLFS